MTTLTKRPTVEEWLATATMIGVMLIGFWQATVSLNSPAVKEISVTLSSFREGSLTGSLSNQLDKNLPIRSELIAWANTGRYLLIQGAGDQVRVGKDNWLFSVEELQYFKDAQAHQVARLAILKRASEALEGEDIKLIVALVPDKARMNERQLSNGTYPIWYSRRYDEIIKNLNESSVAVVDLQSALTSDAKTRPLYYRTDTHWNQAGAQRAADAVAKRIISIAAELPANGFMTKSYEGPIQKSGDLIRMMGLEKMPDWARPQPDVEVTERTIKSGSAPTAGLFDAVSIPVVLLGTSYSLRANFHGYLQQALGTEVLNVARDGGGFIQSAKDYLADESFKTSKPRVIVWEIPERMFSAPLTDLEKKDLLL